MKTRTRWMKSGLLTGLDLRPATYVQNAPVMVYDHSGAEAALTDAMEVSGNVVLVEGRRVGTLKATVPTGPELDVWTH